ncbi:hypothetical protein [uncultured Granulicatella sp.]|nr:hypothetical protein [uncultured Granulicatella sp.]
MSLFDYKAQWQIKMRILYHTFKAGDKGTIGGWKVDILNKSEKQH